jgi:hypothetical protein
MVQQIKAAQLRQVRDLKDYAQIIKNDPNYTPKRSYDWFRRQVVQLGTINTKRFTKRAQPTILLPGNFYIFHYDAKHKDTLPYWDRFPLVVPFNKDHEGFIGLNLHYLHPRLRLLILTKLDRYKVMGKDNQHKLLLMWDFLKNAAKYPEVAPCVKRYLYAHMSSKLIRVDEEDWVIMSQLPTESFVGSKSTQVWTESRKAMGI